MLFYKFQFHAFLNKALVALKVENNFLPYFLFTVLLPSAKKYTPQRCKSKRPQVKPPQVKPPRMGPHLYKRVGQNVPIKHP